MNVFGVGMNKDIKGWDGAQRRMGSLLAIGTAALLVLIGLIVYAIARESAKPFYWFLVVLVVLVFAYEVLVLVLGIRADSATEPATPDDTYDATATRERVTTYETITLRCGDCATVFDVSDTGERPLHHNCPGCGAEGVLREPATPVQAPVEEAADEVAEPVPEPTAAPMWARPQTEALPEPEPEIAMPTPAPAPPMAKDLRLRCGGCKDIFTIEDNGERPLRRKCPHCGRTGVIR